MKIGNSALMLIARLIVGVVLIAHGWQKFNEWTISGTAENFAGMGVPLPEVSAVIAASVELGGGILLIIGLLTRIVGVLVALVMLGAGIFAEHFSAGVFASDGGWELVGVIAAAGLAFAAAGAGTISVDKVLLGRK
ncbi:DoxX family protein [Corynebacterium camporealensis]